MREAASAERTHTARLVMLSLKRDEVTLTLTQTPTPPLPLTPTLTLPLPLTLTLTLTLNPNQVPTTDANFGLGQYYIAVYGGGGGTECRFTISVTSKHLVP